MARGSLELSLNALIVFIVSVIVLGTGFYLVHVFLDIGITIAAPDRCTAELNRAMQDGAATFAVCPSFIPKGAFSPHKSYELEYAFFNLGDGQHRDYGVNVTDGNFESQPSGVYGVEPRKTATGTIVIRSKSGASLDPNEYVKLYVCPLDETTDPPSIKCDPAGVYGSASDPKISRVLTVAT